jgi:hypothetical protein
MKRALTVFVIAVLVGVALGLLFGKTDLVKNTEGVHGDAHKVVSAPLRMPEVTIVADTPSKGAQKITPERRIEILRALEAFKEHPWINRVDAPPPPPPPTRLTTKAYIQERMDEIKPLIAECYRDAKVADPSLGRRIPVAFKIEGEIGVGGLVTEASLHPSLEKYAGLEECVRETLYSLEIDPPEQGGDVDVVYPFDFEESE